MRRVSPYGQDWWNPGIGSSDSSIIAGMSKDKTALQLYYELQNHMRIVKLEQGTKEWLDWRCNGIGGSEVASAVGLNPYCTQREIWRQKVEERKKNKPTKTYENEDMKRGKRLEPIVRDAYEKETGVLFEPICVIHDDYPWLKASLDGYNPVDGGIVLEIKCPRKTNHLNVKRGNIPAYWICQVQHQLMITQAKECHFLSYCEDEAVKSKDQLIATVIKPDKEYQSNLLDMLIEFWMCVEQCIPPE